ncbi:MAG: carboxypeptidase regulatory-like domain-containing protein [Candidatus Acidiferrales bacterium]
MNLTVSRLIVVGIVGLGSLFCTRGGPTAESAAEAGMISGTGALSGKVEAPKPFKAARVYAKNIDKNILFMVYTSAGRFRAVNLLPGNYEVTVEEKGFTSPMHTVSVTAGKTSTLDFSLSPDTTSDGVLSVSYDAMYPQGRGRDLFEKTCMVCHGAAFIPFHHWNESQWNAAITLMSSPADPRILPGVLNSQDRQDLVAYFTKNFGPDSPKRILDIGAEMPLDEKALAKAMYVEYYVPPLPDNGLRQVHDVHFDQDGNVWYSDPGGNRMGRLDPRTGTFQDYVPPNPKINPHGLTVDSEGYVWAVGHGMVRLDPRTGKMETYTVDSEGKNVRGHTVAVDSKKNVWFSDILGNKLHEWNAKTKVITSWEAPGRNVYPYGIVIDKSDNIWMAEWIRCRFVKFDPTTEKFTEYAPLEQPCASKRLRVDSQGMVWYAYSAFQAGKLGMLDPSTGKMVEYTFPMPFADPYDIATDKDGSIWIGDDSHLNDSGQGPPGTNNFAMMKFETAMVEFNRATHKFTYYPSPQKTAMPKIDVTREGAVWFAARDGQKQAIDVLYPDVTKMTTLAARY